MNPTLKTATVTLVLLAMSCKPKADAMVDAGAAATMPSNTAMASEQAPAPSVAVAASAKAPAPAASVAAGTHFWNEATVIAGTLVHKQIQFSPGPVPVVVFDHPITIESNVGDDTPALPGAKEAWLSYNGIDKAAVTKLVGKKVTYRGTLQPAQTAHHLSNPWLDGTVSAR